MHKLFEYFIHYHPISRNIIIPHKSEPAEHIKRNIDHVFNWKILCPAPSPKHLRKNLEAIFIALYKPSQNDQKSFDRLMLFRNGIT